MTLHELKTWPEFFDAVVSGRKTFEVRKDDRGFMLGDLLLLREYDPKTDTYSGAEYEREVTYILRGSEWGVMDGYVVMGLDKPERRAVDYGAWLAGESGEVK